MRDAKSELGVLSIKMTIGQGWPDTIFLIPGGVPLWIEFKATGEPLRPLQKIKRAILLSLGYDVEMHDDYEAAMASIRRRLK